MRVLHVGSSMASDWGGIERYVVYLADALGELGQDVVVAAPPGSPLAAKFRSRALPLHVRGKYDFAAAVAYLRHFRREAYHVVNVHFSPDYLIPAWAATVAGQRGLVLTRHVALPFGTRRSRQYSRLYQGFIGVSGAVVQALEESGLPRDRIHQVDTGVPPLSPGKSRAEARAALGIEPGAFAVGVFSRLVQEKGQDVLVEACRCGGFEAHLFGEGPFRDELSRRASGLPVVFHGQVPDVADAMVAMDAVAMPSVWPEALGLATLEAMSVGVPLVASRVGGIPEAVVDGETGVLVSPRDPVALHAAIVRLRENPDWRGGLARRARAVFEERRTPRHMAESTLEVYRALAG